MSPSRHGNRSAGEASTIVFTPAAFAASQSKRVPSTWTLYIIARVFKFARNLARQMVNLTDPFDRSLRIASFVIEPSKVRLPNQPANPELKWPSRGCPSRRQLPVGERDAAKESRCRGDKRRRARPFLDRGTALRLRTSWRHPGVSFLWGLRWHSNLGAAVFGLWSGFLNLVTLSLKLSTELAL